MTLTLMPQTALNSPKIQKLANGLTIIAESTPVAAVNLNVWLNVGSVLESDAINGMAHFLEHMVFKGTPRLESGQFERLIEERGAVTNAATSQEYTHYYITSAPQDFAELAPLQLDVILNPSIPDDAFARERLVVLEEIRRSEDNPRRRTFYRAMETCFEYLPYRRPVLGLASVIEGLKSEQMRDFHSYWYQPQSMTAAVVGNLPEQELIEIVATAFDKLHLGNVPTNQLDQQVFEPEAPFEGIIRREYVDETLTQARLLMLWRVPGMLELAKTYPLDVLAVILGQGKVSRLFRELREERGLVSQISVSNMSQKYQGVFYISAQLSAENVVEVERAIAHQIERLQTELVAEFELDRIRTQVANRFIFGNERPGDRANLYGYYYSQLGDIEPALNYPSYIQSLEAEDLQQAAQDYLSASNYAIVVIKPK